MPVYQTKKGVENSKKYKKKIPIRIKDELKQKEKQKVRLDNQKKKTSLVWFLLFNGISTFVCYLMPKLTVVVLFNQKL